MRHRCPQVDHQAVADGLRATPGVWGRVGVYPASYSAKAIARGVRTGGADGHTACYAPAGAFEARMVSVEDGTAVEARYVGGPEPGSES